MKTLSNASKIALATAALGLLVAGCDKRPPADQAQGAGSTSSTMATTTPTPAPVETVPTTPPATDSAMAPGSGTASNNTSAGMPDATTAPVTGAATTAGTAVAGAADKVGMVVEDSVITTKLKTAVLADTILKDSKISVETKGGTVSLTGSVVNDAQKDHAAQIAQALEGVKSVDNKLVVATK